MKNCFFHSFIKGIAVFLLVLLLPALAQAWYVSAKTSPTSGLGTIAPAGNTFYVNGVNSQPYTVTPASGYTISKVTIDGLTTSAEPNGTYVVAYNGKSWRYIVAYFSAVAGNLNISISAGTGGGIREVNGLPLTGILPGATRTLAITPTSGYQIATVTASNATPVLNPDGTQTVSYTNLQASQSVSATFIPIPNLKANAGSDVYTQGNGIDFTATLDGSQSSSNQGAISYSWAGPAELVFGTQNVITTTVYSNTAGTFTATLTITSGGLTSIDTALVNVPTRAAFMADYCRICHGTRNPTIMADYDLSQHKTTGPDNLVACQTCHNPTGTQHYTVKRPTDVCQPCHAEVSAGRHGADAGLADQCAACHNSHSGAASSANLPRHLDGSFGGSAQYVSHGAACADCHAGNNFTANTEILNGFAASGHADVAGPAWAANASHDWPTLASCRGCHTRVGFVDNLTGAATAIDPGQTGQILACNACHIDISTGEVRVSAAVEPGFTNATSGTGTYPDAHASNICLRCHSGRSGGSTIKTSTGNFSDLAFINSHYLAAGATLYRAGYEYAADYANRGYQHNFLGFNNGGPCVDCHILTSNSHSFKSVSKDESGAVTAIIATYCTDCHPTAGDISPMAMNNRIAGITAAEEALKAQLAVKGIHFGEAHPYFYTAPYAAGGTNTAFRNWESVYAGKGKEVMGAAFNLNLLIHEPGAYAHNQRYARRLIYDSLDFLNDGLINVNVTIDSLVGSGFPQATADQANAYLDGNTIMNGTQRP